MLAQLFAVIAPVFFTAAVGFAWVKSGRPFDIRQLTPLITQVGSPCLVLSTLLKAEIAPGALVQMAGASALAHGAAIAGGALLLTLARLPRKSFLPALTFPNTGNMGLPLCLFAFGEEGLALAIGYFVVSGVGQFTVGYALAAGTVDWKKLIQTPVIWAVGLAIALIATDTDLPAWAMNTISLIGQFTIPAMLLALGVSLASLQVKRLAVPGGLAVARIAGGAAIGAGVVHLLGLEGPAAGVVLLQSAMPVAVFNYLFAALHGNRPEEVAGLVVVSTALSFATLPFLLAVVLPG